MKKPLQQDWRYAQADKEALLSLGVYALYFVWWYVCAYGLGAGDPDEYAYVFGLPAWFFLSCVAGYPLLALMLCIVVKFFFKNMPLEEGGEEEDTAPRVESSAASAAAPAGKRSEEA